MSYCCMADDSDVYVYASSTLIGKHYRPIWVCCMCKLTAATNGPNDTTFSTRKRMLAHLGVHREAGHQVPARAVERLLAEEAASPKRNR